MDKFDMAASLNWFLKKKEITTSYISRKTGIEENMILKILNRKHKFTALQLLLICDAINTEPMLIIREYKNSRIPF